VNPSADTPVTHAEQLAELAARLNMSPATARKYLRETVTLPDGRRIHGYPPGAAGGLLEEHRLRDELARQLGGITEAKLRYGRADVMTASAVFEVESRRSWRDGVRQVLAYSAQCGLPPALALFGVIRKDELLSLFQTIASRVHAVQEPRLDLWWHNGYRWQEITSRATCANMPAGVSFEKCRHCLQPLVILRGGDEPRHHSYLGERGTRPHHCDGLCQRTRTAGHRGPDCPYWQRLVEADERRRAGRHRDLDDR
jgi:hypothetical protein